MKERIPSCIWKTYNEWVYKMSSDTDKLLRQPYSVLKVK